MKKLLTLIAVLVITTSAFANNEVLTPLVVKSAFETKFGKTINVQWEMVLDVYVARFTNNDHIYQVYYSENGELLASSRYISKSWLPESISTAVKSKFPDSYITQALEFTSKTGGTSYYVIIANHKADLVLHATSDGEINVVHKTKK